MTSIVCMSPPGAPVVAVISHVFVSYPRDMRTRCGIGVLDPRGFPCVTISMAAREDWGGSLDGLAICARCARRV